MERKLQDYVSMGVEHVWVIDPFSREAFVLNGPERLRSFDGILQVPGTLVRADLNVIFAALDQMAGKQAEKPSGL